MAEYPNEYLDSVGVKHLWDKAEQIYIKKESGKGLSEENYTAEEKEKLAELENYELPVASEEVMGGIKVGRNLTMDANGYLNATAEPISEFDWDDVLNTPTTLEGYGIVDAATKGSWKKSRRLFPKSTNTRVKLLKYLIWTTSSTPATETSTMLKKTV